MTDETITVTVPLSEAEYTAAIDHLGDLRAMCIQALGEALALFADEIVREMGAGRE